MDQRRLYLREALFVVAGEVQAEVVVVDRRQLEVGQPLGLRDRRGGPQSALEVPGSPSGGEQQARWPPSVRALERAKRGLEDPSVSWRGITSDVEEQQPVEAGRDRVSVRVSGQRRDPGVLAGRKAGGPGAERDERDLLCAAAQRALDTDTDRRAAGGDGGRSEDESPPCQRPPGSVPVAGITHVIGFQWKVKLTRWGFSQTLAYSTCRAETGGLTSRLSWYVPAPGTWTSLP